MKWRSRLVRILTAAFVMAAGAGFSAYAMDMQATVNSAVIDSTGTMVSVNVDSNTETAGTDGKLYLFEVKPYQTDLTGRYDPIGSVSAGKNRNFSFRLNAGPGEMRLYSAYVAAAKVGASYKIISNRMYITNPEVLAVNTNPAVNNGKKGLLVEPSQLGDALKLNLKHAQLNVSIEYLFGSGIDYYFEGINYHMNAGVIQVLDAAVQTLSDQGIAVSLIVVNGWNKDRPELYRPGVSQQTADRALYYAFNTETSQGFKSVKAIASFLAKRYNGLSGHGKVTNWIIGNELNNQYWNYTGDMDVENYVTIYQRAYRVFYTAIKSESANDNVFFSIDQYWNMLPETGVVGKYSGKAILDAFATRSRQEGEMNWSLALHPYPYPLYDPNFWNDRSSGKVTDELTSPVVTLANLQVITDYMQTQPFLNSQGNVRTIFLTEQGLSAGYGTKDYTQEQSAAIAYAYYIAEQNPYISCFMQYRQMDDSGDGVQYGLSYKDASGTVQYRPSFELYKNIDDPSLTTQISSSVKAILGISSWTELIPSIQLTE